MSAIVFILLATVLLEDRLPGAAPEVGRAWWAIASVAGPPAVALLMQLRAVRRADRLLDEGGAGGLRALRRSDGAARRVGWFGAIGLIVGCFGFGWLAVVRSVVGDLPAVDELLAILPALIFMVASWWIEEPLERRLREAALVRRLDEGLPIPPAPSRIAFVVTRLRATVLLMLVPMLLVIALGEILAPLARGWAPTGWSGPVGDAALFASAAAVYVAAPLLSRLVLALRPLPAGALRDDLLDVAARAGVRIGEIFVWDTHYAMVNGAVLGLVPRFRYVLLTDALLELLPRDELRAVMAHEIGHVRRRHLPWLLVALIALLAFAGILVGWPLERMLVALEGATFTDHALDEIALWVGRFATLAAGALALLGFGWISRRFERQADSFAVQELSRAEGSSQVTAASVGAMAGALESVARYAGVDPARPSWRHGSIRWRQEYLAGVLGGSVERLPIDRTVAIIKVFASLGVVVLLWQLLAEARTYDGPPGATRTALDVEAAEDPCAS